MLPADRLRDKLIVSNGKGVQVYKTLAGAYRFERYELHLDQIHPDPLAPTCLARVRVDQAEAQIPRALWEAPDARVAVEDFLARCVRDAIGRYGRTRWSGRITPLHIDAGGQEILPRTACAVGEDTVEVRLTIALPAEGRKVLAKPAQALFFEDLPAVVDAGLLWAHLDGEAGRRHCETYLDYLALRDALPVHGLVAFVADGSVLAREAGASGRPMRGGRAAAMHAPDELAVTVHLPHRGLVRGLGIRAGVTMITGGLASGKSTLLAAIAHGVYAHVPGDGRELVATVPDAVALRADPGRRVERVDVSGFVHALSPGMDVTALVAERASGVLAMAAGVAEALEVGTTLLLVDEDESAIAFLARDPVMLELLPAAAAALSPLVERVRALWEIHRISTVIATGALGEYLPVADAVIVIDGFQPASGTARARELAAGAAPAGRPFERPAPRCALARGIGGVRGRGLRTEVRWRQTLSVGRDVVDLDGLPQLADAAQARAAGDAVLYAVERGYVDGEASVAEIVDRTLADVAAGGLGVLAPHPEHPADYALPRRQEVAAVLNRLRSLQVRVRRGAGESSTAAGPAEAETPD
ncbi:MAG: ABC-ATPase domain-containing protein [Armatimonadota bacterium]|nr:ABC-ATPase domain-containing protein [Armatimonadota bacterium]MDR7512485.1 ABC-ATPase domain-containing protein [Armatimonadota bacterium]